MRALLCLPGLLPLSGCVLSDVSREAPLDAAVVAALEPGTTTAQEVADLLGAPTRVVELGERSAWLYRYEVEKQAGLFLLLVGLRGMDTRSDRIWVFFDEHDVLTHAGSTFEAELAEYALPGFGTDD